jgi:hypothetical protein
MGWKKRSYFSFFVTQAVPFKTSISRSRAGGPWDGRNVHILASLSPRPFHSGLPFLGAEQEDHGMEETFIF